ncbi:MAG: cell wall metabolism sensor histidine kinase WalK [Actinomycetota bacterium]|nr:cell wall metabolism sensor histidine kinase WalK [Actinomycetota bacterium]
MFQSFLAVPLHFTVEFLGFLVCGGGAFLVLSRETLVPGPPSNRVTAALGLGALAVAQVLHGGAFLPLDGDTLLVGIYSIGFALLAVALSSSIRPSSTAVLGLPIEQPVALAPAGAALFLAVVAGLAAMRGGAKALWRLAAAAFLLALAEIFTAFAPATEFGAGEIQNYANLAHGSRALGFMALGSWLWTGVRSSIRVRFVASFAGLLLVVVLVLSSSLTGVISNNVEEEQLENTSAQLEGIADDYGGEGSGLAQLADSAAAIAGDDRAIASMRKKPDKRTLDTVAEAYLDPARGRDLDFVLFDQPGERGRVVSYTGSGPDLGPRGNPDPLEDYFFDLAGSSVAKKVTLEGARIAANPILVGKAVVVIAAAEIDARRGGEQLGAVIVGRFLDTQELERIAENTSPAVPSLLIEGKVVASLLPKPVVNRFRTPKEVVQQTRRGDVVSLNQAIGSRSYFNAFSPLFDQAQLPVDDTILLLSSPARIVSGARGEVTRILFLVAIGIGAVVLALAWLSGRRITRPIQRLTVAAGAVREGNLDARAEVAGEDEVGQLGETFNEMTEALQRSTNDLRDAALAEQQLRARIETIIQSMADGLVAVGPDHKILAFNPQAEALTGVTAAEAVGKPVSDVIDARDTHGHKFSLPIYDLVEGSVDGVYLERKDGDRVPVAVDSAVLRGPDGDAAGGVAVLRDMTREREVERMKSEFLSNISHELRTPLTPIKGYAEILGKRDIPAEKTKQFAGGILESTARLERIVELLVDFSALEAGRLAPRAKPIDVGGLVEKLADAVRKRTTRHEVIVDVKSRLPKALGDERLLKRSIEEVLDNAVKFSPDGGTIRLEARGASSGNGRRTRSVQVSVIDEGIGIAPEDLSKIFSDFHQLDGSATRTYGGLGLGLAFVQRIVEAHDGSIDVKSELDKGTRLTISIPAAAGRAAAG